MKCEVIRDLMPLVADDVASGESKEIVREHMETCEVCRAYYQGMTAQLARTDGEEGSTFVSFSRRMEKKLRMKKALIALAVSLLLLCAAACGGYAVLYHMYVEYEPMPVEKTRAELFHDDGQLRVMVEMNEGYGWHGHIGIDARRGEDVVYITPYEPSLILWNRGVTGGFHEMYFSEFLWENGRLYLIEYEADGEDVKTEVERVLWGTRENFVSVYEKGDEIPEWEEIMVERGYLPETVGASDGPTSVFATEADDEK